MAVVRVAEKVGARTGHATTNNERTYTKTFIVETDSVNDGIITVGNAAGIPERGEVYACGSDVDIGAVLESVSVRQSPNSQLVYEVVATFKTRPGQDPTKQHKNPLMRYPDIEWSLSQHQRIITKDIVNGNNIENSANDPFSDPIEIDQSRAVLRVTINQTTNPQYKANYYCDCINSDGFAGASAEHAKVASIGGQFCWEDDIPYWRNTYEIHFHPEGFKKKIIDQGYRAKDALGVLQRVKDEYGHPTAQPTFLDGSGGKLDQGGQVVVREFNVYRKVPFSGLGLNAYL